MFNLLSTPLPLWEGLGVGLFIFPLRTQQPARRKYILPT